MTAYGLAHLRPPAVLPEDVFRYLERIQATLDPFGGKFVVHGSPVQVMEGEWPGALVVIESRASPRHTSGTTRPPTARSCGCARTTSPVTW